MEENNRKGPGVFYAVVGVATLVVAIIGATFAYFSAATEPNTNTIKGQTNDDFASSLQLDVERLDFQLSSSTTPAKPTSDYLVPADFGVTPANMTSTLVNNALSRKCVEGGYTGCHVWKITATSGQTIAVADILLHLELNEEMKDKGDWGYVVYTGNDTTADATLGSHDYITTTFTAQNRTIDIHNSGLTKDTPQVYYVMVYLNNVSSSQNAEITEGSTPTGTTNALGNYSGTVELLAAGGQVKATFTSAA